MVDDKARHVLIAYLLYAFQARGRIDLQDKRAALRADQVYARDVQAQSPGSEDRDLLLGRTRLRPLRAPAPMQIRPEVAFRRLSAHGSHHAIADHEAAQVRALGFADELL